jgi:hypothetical protein
VTVDKNKKLKRTISAAVEILGGDASVEPEDENGEPRPGNKKTTLWCSER